ncbi:MAG: hypothetical protein H7Y07_02670 [Pyrinomonadaceae bacterium]|nr:hypothetical protein [Sphingobacteriaceae bacterium]
MKKVFVAALGAAIVFASSCKKDSQDSVDSLGSNQKELVVTATVDTLKGDITVNTTVTKTTFLRGIVYVKPGVTLTVNPGVTIKGQNGPAVPNPADELNAEGTLVVEMGAKLIANGTATNPIVWTSNSPAGSRNYGDWGGIVILGKAPIITATLATTNVFEAFTALPNTGNRNSYGGVIANDNSGSIKYNRIEFGGGYVAAANREVNGLTLCGVGSGTVLSNIEVSNSGDDAFEFFGGRVNADHLLSFGNKDDDYDFDEAYEGNLQFIIAYRNDLADNSGSEMIELDNNASATNLVGASRSRPFIANATFVGPASLTVRPGSGGRFDGGILVRRNANLRFVNSIVSPGAMPSMFITTPTTDAQFIGTDPTLANTSIALNNLFEPGTASQRTRLSSIEGNPPVTTFNAALQAEFLVDGNSYLANYAAFNLGAALNPNPGSPALTGGFNLAPYGFVGTTQRGAVRSTDIWTAGSWISIATN